MTTNIFDGKVNLFCSDSRWSWGIPDLYGHHYATLYVDNTIFDKIEPQPDYSFIFAGCSKLICEWKRWIRSENRVVMPPPRVIDDFAMCMVNTNSGKIEVEHGQRISGSDHRFAGTGAYPAYQCWNANRDANKAVSSACNEDTLSGGAVKYLEMKTFQHNVNLTGNYLSINELALKEGMVMYKSIDKTTSFQEAAINDPIIADFAVKVANGSASAEAPSGKDKIVWTDADVKRLNEALSRCYGVKS